MSGEANGGAAGATGSTGASGSAGSSGAGTAAGAASGAQGGAATSQANGTGAGAGATGGAASGQGTGQATGGGAAAPATTHWQSSFDDTTKDYISNKGWKEPVHMLDSYRNLEKLVGVSPDQVLRLPKADDPQAAEAMNSIYDRLGRPKQADGYKLEIPKENGSPEFAKAASEQFHKLGLSEKQGQDLVKWWNESQANATKAFKDANVQKLQTGKDALKKEWGAAHEQNLNLAKRAAKEFGVAGEVIDAVENVAGYDGVMKLFHSIGSKLGTESREFHTGGAVPGNGAMTPGAARAKIAELRSDKVFTARYLNGDQAARKEMDRLNRFAIGEAAS